jgi:UDPglucose--hexose-1-phosphate uridylyltransferase
LREWVGVAAKRQNRPQLPKDWCPFCPGSGKVPQHYETLLYPNDFAALSFDYEPFSAEPVLFQPTGAQGACDVLIYHKDHNTLPSQMTAAHWRLVVDAWIQRTAEMSAKPLIECVFIFENTGEAIGVTMPHPHGQIYSLPFQPPLVQRELDGAQAYFAGHGENLYAHVLQEELSAKLRIVEETPALVAFVPFAARWPGEVQIYPKRDRRALADLNDAEKTELAALIKLIRMKYDNLYGFQLPLMMLVRQQPARGNHPYFRFHVEFCPIQRSATKIKYLAGVESGAGTFLNDTVAEQRAELMRATAPFTLKEL